MKIITTILLLIMVLGCSAQEPDTICFTCFSQADMDSKDVLLFDTIDYFNEIFEDQNEQLALRNDLINQLITQIDFKDSIIDNSLNIFEAVQDTFSYKIKGLTDSLEITINKNGFDASIIFEDKEIDRRFHFDYTERQRTIQLGDGLVGTLPFNFDWNE